MIRRCDNLNVGQYENLETYRKLGLAGNDGTGSQPIPVGLWTQASIHQWVDYHVIAESEMRLNNFAALAFGVKLLDALTYEHPPIGGNEPPGHPHVLEPVLFEGTGTASPTALFYPMAETNRQIRNLGPTLVRLISTDVRMVMGHYQDGSDTEKIPLPPGLRHWSPSADPYITSVTATNLGNANNGLPGDVILGYFKPLAATFGDEDDIYFLVINGLSDIGSLAAETEQRIRIEFDSGTSDIQGLQRFSRNTGLVETVVLASDGGSRHHLEWVLEGGTGDLFRFPSTETHSRALPGDCNRDAALDLSDAVCALGVLFTGMPPLFPCGDGTPTAQANLALLDWQPDGGVDLSDVIGMLSFLFLGTDAHPLAVPGAETTGCVPLPGCPDNSTGCP